MSLAYHYVADGSAVLDRVIFQGRISPAVERLDLLAAQLRCGNFMATAETRGRVHPFSLDSLQELLEERLGEIDPSEVPEGERTKSETQFHCVDLLAGDLENVFLSVREWPEWLQDPENGFAFDAAFLVRKGAHIRPFDLIDEYEESIWDALSEDRGKSPATLKRLFASIRKKSELSGQKALQHIKDFGLGELVWKGSLPINWAVEIWREGTLEWSRPSARKS